MEDLEQICLSNEITKVKNGYKTVTKAKGDDARNLHIYSQNRRRRLSQSPELAMELEGVDDLALHLIFAKLSPKDSAIAACVSRQFRSSASEDSLWEKFCNQDLNLTDPIDHLGNPIPSFKVRTLSSI